MQARATQLLSLLILFLVFGQETTAQYKHLSLYKANGTIAEKFLVGDQLQIKRSNGTWISGELEYLFSDTLLVAGLKLGLADVHAVRVIRPWLLGTGVKLGTAGLLWPGIVAINGLSANIRPLLPRSTIISATALLASGAILSGLAIRTYTTLEPNRLKIIDFNFRQPIHPPTP
jgi:hypothetical protein